MDLEPEEEEAKRFHFQGGAIKRLTLQNFMCHEKFDLDLGPRVNFIIGPNGSGKSALLTALVVVLGGRATTTSRAKKVSDFVQEGKKFAKITCVINNYDKIMDQDQSFRPDEFGREIIVEKTIYKDDPAAKLVLRDEKMRKVSERKQMLDDILDHFKILINNPICILNQEVSKSFLHSKRPEDKFDLFMRATNLDQIERDYAEAKEAYNDWKDINTKKSIGFRLLDKELAECKEKTNFIKNRLLLQKQAEQLTVDLLWATVRDIEIEAKAYETQIQSVQEEVSNGLAAIEKCEADSATARSEIDQFKESTISTQEQAKFIKGKLEEIRQKELIFRPRLININHAIEGGKSKLERLERDKTKIDNQIKKLRSNLDGQSSQVDEEARRKLELERLEGEVAVERSSEHTKRTYVTQLIASMTETGRELTRSKMKLGEMKAELSNKTSFLNRLIGGRDSELKKYGDHIVSICAEVERAHDKGVFTEKPRGPLGAFIKLKTPDVAKAIEIHLGRNASAFAVDNIQDMMKLKSIINNVKLSFGHNFKEPMLLTRKFSKRHDVSKFKAFSPNYRTLLDLIDIQEDCVYNAVVDRTGLEQVLFIKDYFEAQNFMLTRSQVPPRTRCAYTEGGDIMYPRTERSGFRTVANNRKNLCLFSKGNEDQIEELQQDIADLKRRINIAEEDIRRVQGNYDEQRHEHTSAQRELTSITNRLKDKESELFTLKTTIPKAKPQELSDLETILEDILEQIRTTKINIEKETLNLEALNSELEHVNQKKKLQQDNLKQSEREIYKINEAIRHRKELISNTEFKISQIRMKMAKAESTKTINKEKLEKLYSDLGKLNQRLADKERPEEIRQTSDIRSEQASITRQLQVDIDESQDPEKLLDDYRKRMDDIKKTNKLKEINRTNHEHAQKSLKNRDEGVMTLRNHTCGSVSSTFAAVMRAMDIEGTLSIHMQDHVVGGRVLAKARTLEMSIDTSTSQRPSTLSATQRNAGTPAADRRSSRSQADHSDGPVAKRARLNVSPSEKENQRMTDSRSLSGGERSFSTVAFVLALWHHCASPFKLMDEIDVFMDMVTRRMSYNALIKFAEASENRGQFIYFSPLQLPEIDAAKGLVKVLAMPNFIRRGYSQAAALGADGAGDEQ